VLLNKIKYIFQTQTQTPMIKNILKITILSFSIGQVTASPIVIYDNGKTINAADGVERLIL
jgi:hypothetical protein